MSGKGVNTEKRADVPVIFFDKGIDLAVQMKRAIFSPVRSQTSILDLIQQSKQLPTAHIPSQGIQEAGDQGGMMKIGVLVPEFCRYLWYK